MTAHGRQPSGREVLKLRQQATLSTRPGKEQHLLAKQMRAWRGRAAPVVGPDPAAWVGTLAGRNNMPLLHACDLGVLGVVAGKRATFGRLNVFAEVLRQLAVSMSTSATR